MTELWGPTVRWAFVASVASVVALAVAAPVTDIGRLESSEGRLWVAAIAAALVPAMLAIAAWSGHLLATSGIPQADVESYVLSFYGPIDAETLPAGTTLWRYGAQATGVRQIVILDPSAFSFGHGSAYTAATCAP